MSIATNLTKLQNDISSAYTTIGTKGGTIPQNKNTDNLSTAINSIPSGGTPEPEEKDVNFYDFEGTRLYSYTKTEFLQLSAMPEVPAKTGLTSQGWTYSLTNAQNYVTEYGQLEIGTQYDTSHHGINMYLYLNKYVLNGVTLTLTTSGNATINWGDGGTTNIPAVSGQSYGHNYEQAGNYKISIIPEGNTTITLVQNFFSGEHRVRTKKIEIGTQCILSGARVLYDYNIVESISIPTKTDILTADNQYLICYNRCLKCFILPQGVSDTAQYMVQECDYLQHLIFSDTYVNNYFRINNTFAKNNSSLKNITLPKTNAFYGNSFNSCSNIIKLVIPKETTTINGSAFISMKYTKVFDFTHLTSVPTLQNVNAFNDIYSYKIVVPDNLYNTWKSTNNWSNSAIANNIVKASDFNL